MVDGSYDLITNALTLNFSRPVLASGVSASSITIVGNVSGSRTNSSGGAFGSTSSHSFGTSGTSVTSSAFITVSAPAGIPSVVDAVNGNPVDPFTNLRIDLT